MSLYLCKIGAINPSCSMPTTEDEPWRPTYQELPAGYDRAREGWERDPGPHTLAFLQTGFQFPVQELHRPRKGVEMNWRAVDCGKNKVAIGVGGPYDQAPRPKPDDPGMADLFECPGMPSRRDPEIAEDCKAELSQLRTGDMPRRAAKPGEGAGGVRNHKRWERGTRPA
jgi:hypothetical protein